MSEDTPRHDASQAAISIEAETPGADDGPAQGTPSPVPAPPTGPEDRPKMASLGPVGEELLKIGARADGFVRGFVGALLDAERTPPDGEDAPHRPSQTEQLGRILTTLGDTVSATWEAYTAQRADADHDGRRVIDTTFLIDHGAGLAAAMVQAIGQAFRGDGAHDSHDPGAEDVDVQGEPTDLRAELEALVRALFSGQK